MEDDDDQVIRRVRDYLTERDKVDTQPPAPAAVGYEAADLAVLFDGATT